MGINRIRMIRDYLGLKQQEFIEGICSLTYLSRIENNAINPSDGFLTKIAHRYEINLTDTYYKDKAELEMLVDHLDAEKLPPLTKDEVCILEILAIESKNNDKLHNVFFLLFTHYKQTNPRQLNRLYQLFKLKIKLIPVQTTLCYKLYFTISQYLYSIQDFHGAEILNSFLESRLLAISIIQEADLLVHMGQVLQRTKSQNPEIAYEYSMRALKLYKEADEHANVMYTLVAASIQCHLCSNFEKSLDLLNEAEAYNETHRNKNIQVSINSTKARVYQKIGMLSTALTMFKDCIDMLEPDEVGLVYQYRAITEIYIAERNWECASQYADKVIEHSKNNNLTYMYLEGMYLRAEIYNALADHLSYEKMMKEIIKQAKNENQFSLSEKYCVKLGDYFYQNSYYKQAASYYQSVISGTKFAKQHS